VSKNSNGKELAIIAVVTFKLHGTATQVAMVLVSFMAPLAIVSPLAGVFVDSAQSGSYPLGRMTPSEHARGTVADYTLRWKWRTGGP
jgi:hypothetical protein